MRGDTLQRGTRPADHRQHDRTSQPGRLEDHTGEPLNPLATWSIVLVASVALWAGVGLAVSSVVSALL
jgi:hypothetical protein